MNIKITSADEKLLNIVIAFCNLYFINYQHFTSHKDIKSSSIKIFEMCNDDLQLLLKKIFTDCDKYDFGTIQIM